MGDDTAGDGQLARQVAFVAADLDARGYPMAGVIRQAARALLEVPGQPAHRAVSCVGCGTEVDQPATGRRRRWCGEACRSRHRRR